jgi:predicted AlkP superfamily pyrophosphatase or phosphodiesterase
MTLVVMGIDALDPDLVDPDDHPNLTLSHHTAIETIVSSAGKPSTHELWPTIITGLSPSEHGLTLDDGVSWGSPILDFGSRVADTFLPNVVQSHIGAWLLTNTSADAFRTPKTYYTENGIATVFDGRDAIAIGVPNYVVDTDEEDREHRLRRSMGDLFERDSDAVGGHRTSDPAAFYEQCMEMTMVRIARVRRRLRSRNYELVFGYTSALDLIGHVAHSMPALQERAYEETDQFVGELRADLDEGDELLIISDHGLQDGIHTNEAMVASTAAAFSSVESVLDIRPALERELDGGRHLPRQAETEVVEDTGRAVEVKRQLEDLGYL